MVENSAATSCSAGPAEMNPYLSIVIPFRDEAPSLAILNAELASVLDSFSFESEVIFVDDDSHDEGRESIVDLAATDDRLRLLSLSPHAGQSAALEAGFQAARGEIIATLDADLQNSPADLPRLIEALAEADCVCGVRVDRQDSISKRIASRSRRRRALRVWPAAAAPRSSRPAAGSAGCGRARTRPRDRD